MVALTVMLLGWAGPIASNGAIGLGTPRPAPALVSPSAVLSPSPGATPPKKAGSDADLPGGYHLEPTGAGGYRWRGTGFTALVAADGAVRFENDLPLAAQTTVPVRALAQAIKESNQGSRNHLDGRPDVAPGGFLNALGRNALRMVTNPTLVLNDEDLHHDSHHAAKMSFLEGTARFREGLRASHDRKTASLAQDQIRQRVRSIAADQSMPIAQRHAVVFTLWDECADSPIGQAARASIEDEAGRQFPAGGPTAFRDDELSQLSLGQKSVFAPYRTHSAR